MNYNGDQQQQQQQYVSQRLNQGQQMPMQMNTQGMPMQSNQAQHHQIRTQQGINPNYPMQQMPQANYAQQMRMSGQHIGIQQGGSAAAAQAQQQRLYQQQQHHQQVHQQAHPQAHMSMMGSSVGAMPMEGGVPTASDYINQLPAEIRQQIQAEPDNEKRKQLVQSAFRNQQQIYERQQQQISMQQQQQQHIAAQRLQQQQQQQQQQHQQQQAAQMASYGGAQMTVETQHAPIHMQRIPSQGSFAPTPPSADASLQMQTQSHSQSQQLAYNSGRVSVGASQPRGFPINTQPHHASVGASAAAAQMSGMSGGAGQLPPTMTLQQMNPQQQQQFFQQQQHLQQQQQQQMLQHQQQQQQQQHFQHQKAQQQNVHAAYQSSMASGVHPSQSHPQLQQFQMAQAQQQPQSVPVPSQQSTPQPHLGGGVGGPASHRSATISQQSSPMPPPSVPPHQPHSIGTPASQPPALHAQSGVGSAGAPVTAATGGPASVPSHSQQSHLQKPLSIPPTTSAMHSYSGSPLIQQQPQQQQQQHQQPRSQGGPASVSSIRATTPSIRSVPSVGPPNNLTSGQQAGATLSNGPQPPSVPTAAASAAETAVDQNAPEYRAALDKLKSYNANIRRLLTRVRMDGMEKLVQSIERVIEIIEGRRIVNLKLLNRLIQNVCSTLASHDPMKGIKELCKRIDKLIMRPPIRNIVPDVWKDVNHLKIKVPDSWEELIREKEEEMEKLNRMRISEAAITSDKPDKTHIDNISTISSPNGSRKRKASGTDDADRLPSKRERNVLRELANSLSSTTEKEPDLMVSLDEPVPLRVECLNERFLQLNSEISGELALLRLPYRFDPDYKPISENSPHVQLLVYYGPTSNVIVSNWIPPLRLLIPVDYPKANVQIIEERSPSVAEKSMDKQTQSRDPQAQKRSQMAQNIANRGMLVVEELKLRLEKDKSLQPIELSAEKIIDSKSDSNKTTSFSASITVIVNKWAEIVDRVLATSFKTASASLRSQHAHRGKQE